MAELGEGCAAGTAEEVEVADRADGNIAGVGASASIRGAKTEAGEG